MSIVVTACHNETVNVQILSQKTFASRSEANKTGLAVKLDRISSRQLSDGSGIGSYPNRKLVSLGSIRTYATAQAISSHLKPQTKTDLEVPYKQPDCG